MDEKTLQLLVKLTEKNKEAKNDSASALSRHSTHVTIHFTALNLFAKDVLTKYGKLSGLVSDLLLLVLQA